MQLWGIITLDIITGLKKPKHPLKFVFLFGFQNKLKQTAAPRVLSDLLLLEYGTMEKTEVTGQGSGVKGAGSRPAFATCYRTSGKPPQPRWA